MVATGDADKGGHRLADALAAYLKSFSKIDTTPFL
jgi:hypothetical protein